MDRAWLNDIRKRPRITPLDFLKGREVISRVEQRRAIISDRERELVEGCLFSFCLSCAMGRAVHVIDHHDADYDFVASWREDDGEFAYVPVQLKEVVPTRLNAKASVQAVIDGVHKKQYRNLTVAIRVNQTGILDLDELIIPQAPALEIWTYGAAAQDGSRWLITGSLVEQQPRTWCCSYPDGALIIPE